MLLCCIVAQLPDITNTFFSAVTATLAAWWLQQHKTAASSA
jgi:hypothetical protein